MMSTSQHRTALLVGSSGLLGPQWQTALTELGFYLTTADLSDSSADIKIDLASHESIRSLVNDVTGLNCLVINSGIDSKVLGDDELGDARVAEFANWQAFFDVNVTGPSILANALVPKMKPGGAVIFIGSMYGLVTPRIDVYSRDIQIGKFAKHPAYGASKAALLSSMKYFASRYSPTVSFNMLTLGVVDHNQNEVFRTEMPRNIPTGAFLKPESLGFHLKKLIELSENGLVGHNLVVDGGYTLW